MDQKPAGAARWWSDVWISDAVFDDPNAATLIPAFGQPPPGSTDLSGLGRQWYETGVRSEGRRRVRVTGWAVPKDPR